MPYVYSTATCGTNFVEYAPAQKHDPHSKVIRRVVIAGGHGVASKNLITPQGVVTKVSEDELDFLLRNESFNQMVSAGFITYEKSKKVEPEKKVESMEKSDNSAPLKPSDFTKGKSADDLGGRLYSGAPPK